jgi:hypothetical protein
LQQQRLSNTPLDGAMLGSVSTDTLCSSTQRGLDGNQLQNCELSANFKKVGHKSGMLKLLEVQIFLLNAKHISIIFSTPFQHL